MKIIHIANDANRHGNGIINAMVDLACTQAQMGHEVLVISAGGGFLPLLSDHGVRHISVPHRAVAGFGPLKALFKIAGVLRRERPQVVHCHMVAGLLLCKVTRTLKLTHDFLLVSTIHNEFQRSATLMGQADRVVGVSEAVTESMIKRGISNKKISTVCNGVIGSPRLQPREDNDVVAAVLPPKSVITVAGMYRRKGIDVLLRAFAETIKTVSGARLYIVGDGPDRAEFEALSATLNLGNSVEFMGMRHDASGLMRQAEVFVLASRKDPCPLVIVEAREARCAIVASSVDGIPQLLEFGRAGVLVPADDVGALAEQITLLLTEVHRANELRTATSKNLEWLSIRRATEEYLTLYRQYQR